MADSSTKLKTRSEVAHEAEKAAKQRASWWKAASSSRMLRAAASDRPFSLLSYVRLDL